MVKALDFLKGYLREFDSTSGLNHELQAVSQLRVRIRVRVRDRV